MNYSQLFLFVFFSTILLSLKAQNQKNIWYFGEQAGIDFNSGTAEPLLDGQLFSFEASSAVSDSLGNLLFYTNGGPLDNQDWQGGVWNRNHELMPNGNLDSVNTCNSSAQGALIVQAPGNYNMYYIFTTDCKENSMAGGLRYHLVDMSLDSGLGDVVEKNIPVASDVSESLTGILHENGSDYWIIVRELVTDRLFSYLITSNGIQNPVITSIIDLSPNDKSGHFCVSPDGSKVGYTSSWSNYLFDFDNSTGVFSNPLLLDVPASNGCSFSPNGQVYYVSDPKVSGPSVYQFDLTASDINSSVTIVGYDVFPAGGLQLGPDGKIYQAKNTYLGVVNSPNVIGTGCNFEEWGLYLGGNPSNYGLPNFVNQFIENWCDSYDTINVTSTNSYNSPSGNYIWNTSGIYNDTIPNSNGCDSIITVDLTINPTAIEENSFTNEISVFPNPANDYFTIDSGDNCLGKEVSVSIIDTYGNIHNEIYSSSRQMESIKLLFNHPPGLYCVLVKIGDKRKAFKLIKQ